MRITLNMFVGMVAIAGTWVGLLVAFCGIGLALIGEKHSLDHTVESASNT